LHAKIYIPVDPVFSLETMFQQAPAGWGTKLQLKYLLRLLARKRLIIELLATAILFFTNTTVEQDRVLFDKKTNSVSNVSSMIVEGKALDPGSVPPTVETRVREYFEDTPIMIEIAYCESRFKHYSKHGGVLRGKLIPEDVGVMQINEYFHADTAERLGYDLHSLEGNMAYAKWLYEREGTTPWQPSVKCWAGYHELARR